MGQQIIKSVKSDKRFKLVAITENRTINKNLWYQKPSFNSEKIFKDINLIIDFTVPKCTFEVLKIAAKFHFMVIGTTGFTKKEEDLIKKFSKNSTFESRKYEFRH